MAKGMTEKEVVEEKVSVLMQTIARKTAFFRSNPHRFCEEYLNVHLRWFQKILLYALMMNNYTMYIAARGLHLERFGR